ncbi:MAG TPA: hypothetical protein VFT27_00025 [Actinomycetota bacterium]|nr:hypothetical protein [Actinomycetota bacterium]
MASPLDVRIANGTIPDTLRGVLLDFPWELERLLALDLPIERVRVQDFVWLLDLPFWRERGEWFVLTPNQVRERPDEHTEQWSRVLRAELEAPVHITERHGRPVIIDGIHRLLKADIAGVNTLPARRVPNSMLPLIAAAP